MFSPQQSPLFHHQRPIHLAPPSSVTSTPLSFVTPRAFFPPVSPAMAAFAPTPAHKAYTPSGIDFSVNMDDIAQQQQQQTVRGKLQSALSKTAQKTVKKLNLENVGKLSGGAMTRHYAQTARKSMDEDKAQMAFALWQSEQQKFLQSSKSAGLFWETRLSQLKDIQKDPFLLSECCEFLNFLDLAAFHGSLAILKRVLLSAIYHNMDADAVEMRGANASHFMNQVPYFIMLQKAEERLEKQEISFQKNIEEANEKIADLEKKLEEMTTSYRRAQKLLDKHYVYRPTREMGCQIYIGESVALESKLKQRETALRIELDAAHTKEIESLRDDANYQYGERLEAANNLRISEKKFVELTDKYELCLRNLDQSTQQQIQLEQENLHLKYKVELLSLRPKSPKLAKPTPSRQNLNLLVEDAVSIVVQRLVDITAYKEATDLLMQQTLHEILPDGNDSMDNSHNHGNGDKVMVGVGTQTERGMLSARQNSNMSNRVSTPPWRDPSPRPPSEPSHSTSRGNSRHSATRPVSRDEKSFFLTETRTPPRPPLGPL